MKHILLEPSTWSGIGLLAQALLAAVPAQYQPLFAALSAAAGAAAVALREKGGNHVAK